MEGDFIDVVSVNIHSGIAVLDDGSFVPIVNYFGSDGEECCPDDAVAAVAGPIRGDLWISIDLSLFSDVMVH